MGIVFYFFVKSTLTDNKREFPICTDQWLGDIGSYVEWDGIGYTITDYAVEEVYFGE